MTAFIFTSRVWDIYCNKLNHPRKIFSSLPVFSKWVRVVNVCRLTSAGQTVKTLPGDSCGRENSLECWLIIGFIFVG